MLYPQEVYESFKVMGEENNVTWTQDCKDKFVNYKFCLNKK